MNQPALSFILMSSILRCLLPSCEYAMLSNKKTVEMNLAMKSTHLYVDASNQIAEDGSGRISSYDFYLKDSIS